MLRGASSGFIHYCNAVVIDDDAQLGMTKHGKRRVLYRREMDGISNNGFSIIKPATYFEYSMQFIL